jgi:thiamine pyrophosphate-dependent acetolactate synthase large subunit-like protein
LHQLLRIVQLLEDTAAMSIFGLPGEAIAAAVDHVLADQRERVVSRSRGDGEAAGAPPHHRFVVLRA